MLKGEKEEIMIFFKTILFSCCKKINTKFSIPSFLRSFHLFFLPVWHHSPSPCIFHFFLSIVSNIFLSIVSRVFLSIVSKYFFAPLVVLALTNVPCLTLSPRKNPKHHFLNFIMTRKSEAWFNENLRKYKKPPPMANCFFFKS